MDTRKNLSLIISLIYALSFIGYATFTDVEAFDILLYSILGFAMLKLFQKCNIKKCKQ
ncbi:hypothetical protein [Nonlabens spongiae]|uniref:hypothetical protein n=1 Tax=Nonlabens spongiae TaxID=331648 RepID=UPI0012F4CBA2|nr:hypothetical protein [Nonlabens spongiae]